MTELTIRRIAMSLIADSYRYLEDMSAEERTIALAYMSGVVAMANELIEVCGTEGDTDDSH
jgi:hypothetical protein